MEVCHLHQPGSRSGDVQMRFGRRDVPSCGRTILTVVARLASGMAIATSLAVRRSSNCSRRSTPFKICSIVCTNSVLGVFLPLYNSVPFLSHF